MELNQQIILQLMTAVVYTADVINCWGKLDQISILSSIADGSIQNTFLPLEEMTPYYDTNIIL